MTTQIRCQMTSLAFPFQNKRRETVFPIFKKKKLKCPGGSRLTFFQLIMYVSYVSYMYVPTYMYIHTLLVSILTFSFASTICTSMFQFQLQQATVVRDQESGTLSMIIIIHSSNNKSHTAAAFWGSTNAQNRSPSFARAARPILVTP